MPSVTVMSSAPALVIDLLVLGLLLYRQLQVRPLGNGRLALILIVLGLVELLTSARHYTLGGRPLAVLAGSLVLSVLLGALRATTVRLWDRGGQVVRQGTWITAALWLVSVGSHLTLGALLAGRTARVLDVATLLYLGVTLGAQRLVLQARAGAVRSSGRGTAHQGDRVSP